MANRSCRLCSGRALALGLAVWLAQPVAALTEVDVPVVRDGLGTLTDVLKTERDTRSDTLNDLLTRHGLDGLLPERGPADRLEDVDIQELAEPEIIDFRPVLALLSQGHTPEDNATLLKAQGPDGPRAIAFRKGVVTADHLRASIASLAPGLQTADGALRLPVILWQDTVLRLGPGDDLIFGRADGAFLVSLGRVDIIGSTLRVSKPKNPRSPAFSPFVAVAGGGQLQMRDATILGLGFGWTDKFSGVAVLRHPFMMSRGPSIITGTRFDRVVSLVLSGSPEATVTGNRFFDMRGNAVRVSLSPGATIAGNLFTGPSPTNAIRVLDKSGGSSVEGNLILAGNRVGILVNGGSGHVTVKDNVLWRRNGGGIKFKDTHCGLVADNLVLDNKQKGIEVYTSPGMRILRNRIEGNRSAALWISGQPKAAVTHLAGNVLRGNGTGLSTATAARIWLDANDFTDQLPRLVGGDIAFRNNALVRDLKGRTPLILTAAKVIDDATRPNAACGSGEVE